MNEEMEAEDGETGENGKVDLDLMVRVMVSRMRNRFSERSSSERNFGLEETFRTRHKNWLRSWKIWSNDNDDDGTTASNGEEDNDDDYDDNDDDEEEEEEEAYDLGQDWLVGCWWMFCCSVWKWEQELIEKSRRSGKKRKPAEERAAKKLGFWTEK